MSAFTAWFSKISYPLYLPCGIFPCGKFYASSPLTTFLLSGELKKAS